jgi:hypothetical protein
MIKKARREFLAKRRLRHFKWEFLRRNREYQLEFAQFKKRFPEWVAERGLPVSPPVATNPEAVSFFKDQVEPAIDRITKRWCIVDPADPSLSSNPAQSESWMIMPSFLSPEQVNDEQNPALFQPTVLDCSSRSNRSSSSDSPHNRMELRFVKFQIDIAQPLESIFTALEDEIETAKFWYRVHVGELPEFRKRPRARIQEYESYLKVWDLRAQGHTFEQIAFMLFRKEMKSSASRSAATKRVRTHFERAQKLINGEYRQIET